MTVDATLRRFRKRADDAEAEAAALRIEIEHIIDVAQAGDWEGSEIPDPVAAAIARAGVALRKRS